MSDRPTTRPRDDERSGDDAATVGYADALAELERILVELESADVDVDRLADRVRRAGELIRLCRARISDARFHVEQLVEELDGG